MVREQKQEMADSKLRNPGLVFFLLKNHSQFIAIGSERKHYFFLAPTMFLTYLRVKAGQMRSQSIGKPGADSDLEETLSEGRLSDSCFLDLLLLPFFFCKALVALFEVCLRKHSHTNMHM